MLRTRTAGDFLMRLSAFPPGLCMPLHHHPRAYFCFVVRGGFGERREAGTSRFEPESVHFHPAGEPHAARVAAAGMTCMSIIPLEGLAERLAAMPPVGGEGARRLQLRRHAARVHRFFEERDGASDLSLEAAGLELVAGLVREAHGPGPARRPRWLDAVCERIHQDYATGITLRDLAALAGVHEVHLVRAFRRHEGMTPGAYLRQLRIEAARAALVRSPAPIAEIALTAGYSDQSHFTRAFHRLVGLPPAAYRQRHARRST